MTAPALPPKSIAKHYSLVQAIRSRAVRVSQLVVLTAVITLMSPARPLAHAEGATPPRITWARDRNDPHWVQGQVNVGATPGAVWTRVADVPNWPKLLNDVKWVQVLERSKNWLRVKLETRTFDCGAHEYTVTLHDGQRLLTFEIDAPGIDSRARVLVRPGASAAQANVVYSLYVRATGIMGWFISEKELRKRQETMMLRALTDIQRTFGTGSRP